MKEKLRQWHPRIWTVMALTSAFILALTIGGIVLVYRLSLENVYDNSLRQQLNESLYLLNRSDFSEDSVLQIRSQGIHLLLLSDGSLDVLYQDPNGEPLGFKRSPIPSSGTDPESGPFRADAELIGMLVNDRLGQAEGSFFFTELDEDDDSIRLDNQRLYLGGRSGRYLFCLYLPVESTNAAISLAIRFATVVGVFGWLISVVVLYFVSIRLTRPHRTIVRTAEKFAEMDFSDRCPPAVTRELNELSSSVNRMADRLQSNVEHLYRINNQLKVELDERNRQTQITRSLIADLSHDLKMPIGIISGYAEGLQEGIASTPEQQQLYCSMILKESEHMHSIVSKLLAQSRVDNMAYPLTPEYFDLAELLDDVTSVFQLEIRRLKLHLTLEYQAPLPVFSDYESIRQSVVNYVQNAVYHINGGSEIRVGAEPMDDYYRVRVINSSQPIPAYEQDQLWTRLYRGDPSRRRHPGGTGLGLSIVKGNMERLGLNYGQRNLPGDLVEFWLCVPRANQGRNPKPTAADE